MKHKLFFRGLLLLAFLSTSGFLFAQKTETRNVSGFSAIEAGSVFEITVNKSATESLVIEADEKVLPHVRSEVKNGVLKLYLDGKVTNVKTLKATIGMKELKKIALSGASKLVSNDMFNVPTFDMDLSGACSAKLNIKTDKLNVDASGACKLDLVAEARKATFDASGSSRLTLRLTAAEAFFDVSGACKADIKGRADKAVFDVSGACNINAGEWACKVVSADCTGASKLTLNVSERLNVDASGASAISYKGRPIINVETSGTSKVKSAD